MSDHDSAPRAGLSSRNPWQRPFGWDATPVIAPRRSILQPRPWNRIFVDIAGIYCGLARTLDRPLPEFVLGEIVALGRRECSVFVSREGICVEGLPWSWAEWQGTVPTGDAP